MSLKDQIAALDRAEKALASTHERTTRLARNPKTRAAYYRAVEASESGSARVARLRDAVKTTRRTELCQGSGVTVRKPGNLFANDRATCQFCERTVGVSDTGTLLNHPRHVDVHAATSAGDLVCGASPTERSEYTDDPAGLRRVTCVKCRNRMYGR